jgi:hypothetical protein
MQVDFIQFSHLNTVVFRSNRQSRVTHPPLDIEIWQGSHITRQIVEPPERHTGLKIACKTKKPKFSFRCRKFHWCHAKFGCCRNVELVFESRVTPSVDLNEYLPTARVISNCLPEHCPAPKNKHAFTGGKVKLQTFRSLRRN